MLPSSSLIVQHILTCYNIFSSVLRNNHYIFTPVLGFRERVNRSLAATGRRQGTKETENCRCWGNRGEFNRWRRAGRGGRGWQSWGVERGVYWYLPAWDVWKHLYWRAMYWYLHRRAMYRHLPAWAMYGYLPAWAMYGHLPAWAMWEHLCRRAMYRHIP